MPTIVYQVNPKTGIKYAYESISYWDKDKKAPRSKRRYIGRVDPETGEIIKASRGKKKEAPAIVNGDAGELQALLEEKDAVIASLQEELDGIKVRYQEAIELLEKIQALAGSMKDSQ